MNTYVNSYTSYVRDLLLKCELPKQKINLIVSAFHDSLYENTKLEFLKYIENDFTGWNSFKLTEHEYDTIIKACNN